MSEATERFERSLGELLMAANSEHDPRSAIRLAIGAIRELAKVVERRSALVPSGAEPGTSMDQLQGRQFLPTEHSINDLALRMYKERRKRDELFKDLGLFGEPAWDILLDAYSGEVSNKTIKITSACAASGVPTTTALRWITVLISQGLLLRVDDNNDHRRAFIKLTEFGREAMERYFGEVLKLRRS